MHHQNMFIFKANCKSCIISSVALEESQSDVIVMSSVLPHFGISAFRLEQNVCITKWECEV